jgi:hypothetical protein
MAWVAVLQLRYAAAATLPTSRFATALIKLRVSKTSRKLVTFLLLCLSRNVNARNIINFQSASSDQSPCSVKLATSVCRIGKPIGVAVTFLLILREGTGRNCRPPFALNAQVFCVLSVEN